MNRSIAAGWAALSYVGITVGRAIGGLLALRYRDTTMIRLGQAVLCIGIVILLVPLSPQSWSLAALLGTMVLLLHVRLLRETAKVTSPCAVII